MGYLSYVFNSYYSSDNDYEKEKLKNDFKQRLWESVPYKKIKKHFSFRVMKNHIADDELYNEIRKYSSIEYKLLKSRYSLNEVESEDLIRARINSLYGKYFDEDVYLCKDYYKHIAYVKNIYIRWLEEDQAFDVISEFNTTLSKANEFKLKSLERKYKYSWHDYTEYINKSIDRIFNTYVPFYENKNFVAKSYDNWNEDNYIVGYVCKSLDGYCKDLIKKITAKPKSCTVCGVIFEEQKTKRRFCSKCKKIRDNKCKRAYDRKRKEINYLPLYG